MFLDLSLLVSAYNKVREMRVLAFRGIFLVNRLGYESLPRSEMQDGRRLNGVDHPSLMVRC